MRLTDVLTNQGEIITRSSVSHQLMMTSAQVIETSATTTDNGPYQDFAHRTITLQDDMLTRIQTIADRNNDGITWYVELK